MPDIFTRSVNVYGASGSMHGLSTACPGTGDFRLVTANVMGTYLPCLQTRDKNIYPSRRLKMKVMLSFLIWLKFCFLAIPSPECSSSRSTSKQASIRGTSTKALVFLLPSWQNPCQEEKRGKFFPTLIRGPGDHLGVFGIHRQAKIRQTSQQSAKDICLSVHQSLNLSWLLVRSMGRAWRRKEDRRRRTGRRRRRNKRRPSCQVSYNTHEMTLFEWQNSEPGTNFMHFEFFVPTTTTAYLYSNKRFTSGWTGRVNIVLYEYSRGSQIYKFRELRI